MKHAKKFASLLLALVMVFALATTAFAAGTNSITVKNAVKDQEYKLYKMLDLVVDTDLTAYSYTVNSAWADFFKAAGETTPAGKGLSYVNIDAQGYVLGNADITICCEQPKINPHIVAMQDVLAWCLNCSAMNISIKATTTEKLGYTGRGEGIAAYAVVLLKKKSSDFMPYTM